MRPYGGSVIGIVLINDNGADNVDDDDGSVGAVDSCVVDVDHADNDANVGVDDVGDVDVA